MIIDIDGHRLVVPEHIEAKIFEQFHLIVLDMFYKTLPKPVRLALKPFTRNELRKIEENMNAAGRDGKTIRPPDGAEPSLHYLKVMLNSVQVGMQEALVLIDSEPDTHEVTAFNLSLPNPGKGGGYLNFGGSVHGFTEVTETDTLGKEYLALPEPHYSESGGSVSTGGHIGEREDNRDEVTGQGIKAALPDE